MNYWRAWERVVLGAALALSFSLMANAQEKPVDPAQPQTMPVASATQSQLGRLLLRQSMTTLTGIL